MTLTLQPSTESYLQAGLLSKPAQYAYEHFKLSLAVNFKPDAQNDLKVIFWHLPNSDGDHGVRKKPTKYAQIISPAFRQQQATFDVHLPFFDDRLFEIRKGKRSEKDPNILHGETEFLLQIPR